MPVVVKDYKWKQTENTVIITVPLRGVHQSKVDLFYSERYIKANYEQFFFEVLLFDSINVSESRCTLTTNEMIFELTKIVKNLWDTLEPSLSKKEKMELKLKLIQEEHQKIQAKDKEVESTKCELKRLAVSEQMKIDAKIKENIERIKSKEQVEALGDLKEWQSSLNTKTTEILRKKKKKFEKYLEKHSSEIYIQSTHFEEEEINIPAPRSIQQLEVDFTPRMFPTPMRESKTEEENEWLRKQAEARRSVGFISEDLRSEEKNPVFLLKKGDEFMNNHNYLGALSAYSFGIKLSDKFVDLYIARSKAHFAQGNFQKTAFDCSTALDLMEPKVESNLKERAECIGRRGMALCKLKMLSKGIDELEASLKLAPNEEFSHFLKEAEKEWMDNNDSD